MAAKRKQSAKKSTDLVSVGAVQKRIYLIRDTQAMLDSDLAELYGVETGALTRAVRRNKERFPADFMFQLTQEEWTGLRSQIGISNEGRGGRRYRPLVFSEQGVAMLSSVLRSKRAAAVNVEITPPEGGLRERSFAMPEQLRALSHSRITRRLGELRGATLAQLLRHCSLLLSDST